MIEIEHLSKSFRGQTVLQDISCRFATGKIHGLVGNNGSGKTVLMKCICGFLRPDRGFIWIDGKRVGKDYDFPPNLGMILETPGFLSRRSGYGNLKLLASLQRKIGRKEIAAAMERVGLDPHLKKPVAKYSLGMRQRLGIAQALMENPDLLIFDEPFNGLDKQGVTEIRTLLLNLKHTGKTILIASHNPADISALCDTVHEMDRGELRCITGNRIAEQQPKLHQAQKIQ